MTAYAFLDKPATAEAALHSGHYWAASKMLSAKAEQGDARAQNALANLYYLGLGVEQSHTLASRWYLKAALQANSDAQINVARQYRLGHGLPRDELRAYAWLVQARSNQNEIAEVHMKLLAGGMQLTPNQMQRAKVLYPKLEDLRPKERQNGDE
ncbi:MAG: tetratricopeptide repeat protein [Hyphomicrobiales bacterium]